MNIQFQLSRLDRASLDILLRFMGVEDTPKAISAPRDDFEPHQANKKGTSLQAGPFSESH